jgi:hypothetical protein
VIAVSAIVTAIASVEAIMMRPPCGALPGPRSSDFVVASAAIWMN